ncbi:MAG: cyclic nucleotide-binding domain-containing protein [Rhodospirillaceae bacterium]|jgi:CRP-like cAMP-binding protein|nr:cyclic nucleotide-binding domain-containing protein [Rhodospirillales bacterium]MBT3904425.1 cyclic nucleotide-binding domain-containing protein [Rhodospirillaceae bacterium]MBT4701209.1 cyclic nucleotide-binding domain-containing protein [Rhodospirillaceae bacterium]MBT5034343.1 cyclic nucleotide-binding domain-containing protein [Rhodospirillaceae bacterium]MBT6219975.1 cyclic nucleotide-binding domain-containing protein [Rhodospirillaceae bacterium]
MSDESFDRLKIGIGERLFREGEPGDRAYIVQSGTLKVTKTDNNDIQKTIATVKAGAIIGEMALIDDQPRGATAIALEDTMLTVISAKAFKTRLKSTDPVVFRLLTIFAKRLRDQNEIIMKLGP